MSLSTLPARSLRPSLPGFGQGGFHCKRWTVILRPTHCKTRLQPVASALICTPPTSWPSLFRSSAARRSRRVRPPSPRRRSPSRFRSRGPPRPPRTPLAASVPALAQQPPPLAGAARRNPRNCSGVSCLLWSCRVLRQLPQRGPYAFHFLIGRIGWDGNVVTQPLAASAG